VFVDRQVICQGAIVGWRAFSAFLMPFLAYVVEIAWLNFHPDQPCKWLFFSHDWNLESAYHEASRFISIGKDALVSA